MTAAGKSGEPPRADGFAVTPWMDWLGGWIERNPALWLRLGRLESRLLSDDLADRPVRRPIYVAGLARAGTTILLEVLARHPDLASHRYKDFPPIFTPYVWNRLLERMPQKTAAATERAHKDGIAVTPDSPEALEEPIWMAFFRHLHDPAHVHTLDGRTANPAFERFYRLHIGKLVRVRGGERYLAKGNYNLTRLQYIQKLFHDARFVVPVRRPEWHIASLMKQHRLFNEGVGRHPKAAAHLRRVGHFEFGPDRRAVNVDPRVNETVRRAWAEGREVEGWARYWASLYGDLADRLETDAGLREATLVVRYEDLCDSAAETLSRVFAHCGLADEAGLIAAQAKQMRAPTYYRPDFTAEERRLIADLTAPVVARFGYVAETTHAA
ncbi:sulfotransferase [Marinivivus vitaminiproducens]|uniref:sulfotransferase n=1 Tax=Marinivivus vitaminiproducens TaxID=3035935 RepID=UPI0027AA159B|nr:sulfotransferase [Geminicoccaceae bacterium SCSIO 64248]